MRQKFYCSHETLLPLAEVFIADFRNATTSLAAAVLLKIGVLGTFWAARIRVLRKTDKRRCGKALAAEYGILLCTPWCILVSPFSPGQSPSALARRCRMLAICESGPCIRIGEHFVPPGSWRLRARGQKLPDLWIRPNLTVWTGRRCRYRPRHCAVF